MRTGVVGDGSLHELRVDGSERKPLVRCSCGWRGMAATPGNAWKQYEQHIVNTRAGPPNQ